MKLLIWVCIIFCQNLQDFFFRHNKKNSRISNVLVYKIMVKYNFSDCTLSILDMNIFLIFLFSNEINEEQCVQKINKIMAKKKITLTRNIRR